ncbi:MAG: AAA family ATPase [Candidatus Omnitrophica bacterium]|nr:AAA family ATPase [Candidatus Omnitrophota bacterium]MBU4303328.1 AAA family ATPase [Candidatus Omnitrophota bacterium]MBU4418846.1 AAA family ATPase [Candidatus Omnitrophota bacterium]MBU4468658.1 AAA family ATPase [Candidatus Omnitrophota bacterium]MCG2707548.1 AAA family ATPase [Candidatus Omnitrophota bacterium]
MRIITVSNQKGGCGKTTTSINLAAALATNNRKVLLIDLDPQAHATNGLDIKANLSIYNVLSKITNKKCKLEEIIQNLGENFDIAPSNIVLSTLEQELSGEIGRESRLCDILKNFKNNYDYILIDCPPNLGILTINAIRAANEIIIPVEASRFSLEGVSQLTSIINLVAERLNHRVDFKILVANFDSRLQHSFIMLEKIKNDYKNKMFSNIIHVNVKLKEAQNAGLNILAYDKYCRGAKDYFSLSREIITQEDAPLAVQAPAPVEAIEKTLKKRMKEILKEELPKLNEIVLSLSAPDAKEVYIAGEFNNWKLDENSRMEQTNGCWTKRLNLNNGNYRYRFVIDGNWSEDPANPLTQLNTYGTLDSLLEVNKGDGSI